MLCPSCNNFRLANNAPCPFCQAPSPLASNAPSTGNAWGGQQQFTASGVRSEQQFTASGARNEQQFTASGPWGGAAMGTNEWNTGSGQFGFPPSPWQDSSNAAQQLAFSQAAQQGGSSFWSQAAGNVANTPEQSLLPVPYQEQAAPGSQALMVRQQPFPMINPLLPALPEEGQDAPVYVAPMYTKPRPLIPRHRAISGLISVLVVFGMLCAGTSYYAQVTGKLAFFEKLIGVYSPAAITVQNNPLPVPSLQQTLGTPAAYNIITSAVISDSKNVDTHTGNVANPVNQFKVGDTIWLICNFPASQSGKVSVKWYSDNHFYMESPQETRDFKATGAAFHIIYAQATEGKAEIYWNNQLARTLLFVVEPSAT